MFILSINNILAEIFGGFFVVCAVDLDRFSIVLNIELDLCDVKRKKNYNSDFILISSIIWPKKWVKNVMWF